jgi:hypothetical protein
VHGIEGSFITTIEMEGKLSFNSDKLPSNFFIDTLLRNAFKGRNEQLYLDKLLAVDDDFLQNLTYLILDINKSKVTESPIQDDTSKFFNVDGLDRSVDEEDTGIEKVSFGLKWVETVMWITCAVLAVMILSCSYYMYRRCKEQKITKNKKEDKEPMKVIKLPVKQRPSSSSRRTSGKRKSIDYDNDRISPTSTATALSSPGSIGAKMDRPPPSPQRSMTSQASSAFTYTDNMSRFTFGHGKHDGYSKAPSPSNQSKFSIDVPGMDLNIWKGGRQQDPPAFGADISVIKKQRDLSFIPEERIDIEHGLKKNTRSNARRNTSSNRYPSRKSRVNLDARHSKSRLSNRSESYFYSGRHGSNDDNDSDGAVDMTGNDVVDDLNNLSIQIERQRRIKRSKRAPNQ